MNKLNISIDLLALQGACKATIKGEECVVIRLGKSRAKPHQNGKVYLNLEAIENRQGEDKYGNTHFICEPTTKDERAEGVKLPIIGNGKVFTFGQRQDAPKRQETVRRTAADALDDAQAGIEGDEIPF